MVRLVRLPGGMHGRQATGSRLALNRLMEDAGARKFDVVLCWKLDRFGRSLRDWLNNLHELNSRGVGFTALDYGAVRC